MAISHHIRSKPALPFLVTLAVVLISIIALFYIAIAGLLNLIPYIGIFISLLLSIAVAVATAGAGHLLLLIVTLFGIHLLDANLFERIDGLKPWAILLGDERDEKQPAMPFFYFSQIEVILGLGRTYFNTNHHSFPWSLAGVQS